MNKKNNVVRRSGGIIAIVCLLSAMLPVQAQEPPLQTCSAGEVRATERWWYFGENGGIDFGIDGTTATAFLGGQTTVEGSTVVTDTSGQLQFWSNGQQVFDRFSNPMPNGDGLLGNFSATQTVAAFPSLTQPGRYFVVTTSTDVGQGPNGNLTYSVVDMSLNGGLGDVVAGQKNLPLGANNTASEALIAVPNADGTGFWVMTYTNESPNFLAYAFDGDGPVTGNAVVSVMPGNHHNGFGSININADLDRMVLLSGIWPGNETGTVRLLQFDAETGQAFQSLQWGLPVGTGMGNAGYSADFSPAGDYVYVTKIFGDGQLYRYDIATNITGPDVEASIEQLGSISNGATQGGQVRRAPDGRMYVAGHTTGSLSVVNDPDNPADPGFDPAGFALPAGAESRFGLPQTVTGCAEPVQLPEPEPFVCEDQRGYILFDNPTQVAGVDLVTGESETLANPLFAGQSNAWGYNVTDDTLWGYHVGQDQLVRVDADWEFEFIDIADLPTRQYNVGDVSADGVLYLYDGSGGSGPTVWIERVDVNPASDTYLQRLDPVPLNPGREISDWAFSPIDGMLYTKVGLNRNVLRIDPETGAVELAGQMTGGPDTHVGSVFMDAAGSLYLSVSNDGDLWRVRAPHNDDVTVEFLAASPSTGNNDGARCPLGPLNIDFGDAPASYGTTLTDDGARHGIPLYNETTQAAPLMLGAQIDPESDGQPVFGAGADDFDDGVSEPIVLIEGTQTTVTVTVTNDTGEPATLAGWIDLDNDGAFDAAERDMLTVPAGTNTYELTFDPATTQFDTYARFRVFPGTVADPSPAGPASAGEVEDYAVAGFLLPPLQTCTVEQARASERWWFFGDRAGIDFDVAGTTATALLNPEAINTPEGSTVVTDVNGDLLFWSNEDTAYDRNHNPMPNGSGLLGTSPIQGGAAFPAVEVPGRYFIVTTDTNIGSAPNGQLRYSVVDMTLNNGLGDIVAGQKNIPLGAANTASEALTAVPNADGTGFWVLTFTNNSPNLLAYEFDSNGPVGGAVVTTLSTNNGNWFGSLHFNRQLTALVQTTGANPGNGELRLLDFDAASGQADERFTWPAATLNAPSNSRVYTADFSPGGDYVYLSRISGGGRLYRYRIEGATSVDDILNSLEFVGNSSTNAGGHIRRAPDGRMYAASNASAALDIINDPDNPVDPDYVAGGFPLAAGSGSRYGLPQTVTGCPLPPVPTDFGDAPESYGTLFADDGARHVIADYDSGTNASSLMLGSSIDIELDGVPSASADGDDLTSLDDEDAFGVMPPININLPEYTVDVPVHNATGADADLVGWVDFNRNGQFDAGEAATAIVADGQTTATLSWTGLDLSGQFGGTYARLRIAPAGEIDADASIGEAMGGEVEDYTAQFVDLPPPFVECPVSDEPPPTNFTIQERWRTPNTAGQRTLPYQTPVVGDLYGTGEIVAVVAADNGFIGNTTDPRATARALHIIRGSDGALLDTIGTPRFNWFGQAVVAIADADGDGVGEVFMKAAHHDEVAAANRGRLFAYKYDGTSWSQWWVSDTRYDYGNNSANTNNDRRSGHALSIADFNGDGIPEIFIGNQIFNARTGVRLAARPRTDSAGCVLANCIQGSTAAVDMDDDGQLELVAGNVVYKVNITNTGGGAGNSITIWQQADAVAAMGDGFTSVADIDLDGDPDVVIVRSMNGANDNNAHLFVWDGQTSNVLGAVHANQLGTQGSQPMIGDIDGDGIPEIVFVTSNQLNAYKYQPGTGLVAKWNTVTSDGSGQTSFALFDFNNNGRRELVYRDETNLRILDGSGANAVDLVTFPCFSGTRAEMPVIAAVDGTREARILVTCSTINEVNFNARGSLRLYQTGDPVNFPWANTRPVWNQQTYFVAHVNDDLTIPSNQFPHWTGFDDPGQQCSDGINRPLNAFQQQVTDLDPSNGCPVQCVPEIVEIDKALTGEDGAVDGVAEPGELLTYTITLNNVGGVDAENYSVIDQLDPNVVFVSADMGGIHDGAATGGEVEWTGLLVPADDFIELTVTVQVVDPIPPGVSEIGNVAYNPDEGPPDCDQDPIPPNCTETPTPDTFYDFGDAPESYGTLFADGGAQHAIADYDADNFTASLMLGASVDDELDGFPSAGADGDDNDILDDEDAFGVMPPIDINQTEYTIDVPVHNATGADALLVGWIDFNRNGQFDTGEAVTATVADGQATATLSWTGLSLGGQFGSTYVRLRIAPLGEIDTDTPIGAAAGGEVEDYLVPFVDLPGPPFSDCPVSDDPPPTDFTIQERWATPDVEGQRMLAYQTPVVGDLYGTGQIVAVVGADNGYLGGTVPNRLAKDLHIVNGVDGTVIDTIVTPHFGWSGHAVVAIADITGDGQGEIILKAAHTTDVPAAQRGRLIAYLNDGTELWVSDERYDYGEADGRGGGALGFADFDGDGAPEVYIGTQIFDAATGTRLAAVTAADSAGCPYRSTVGCFWNQATAVDMDDDGQLELVAGDTVYKVDLANPDPLLRLTVWQQADASVGGVGDGWTAVADIDLDGTPDVVVVRTNDQQSNGNTILYVWDGQTSTVKSLVTGIGVGGGAPLLGDIDGDGNAEIVMVNQFTLRAFDFDPGTGLVSKWTISTNDGSALTSLAMFDFNNDGSMELVYRDEEDIRIIDGSGATAVDLASFACTSGTATEMPVIAALDGTRQARILATCGTVAPLQRGVLRSFETASFPWANTRPVWNQQAYFVAHINDDLSVPDNQFPHWTPFNDAGQQCSDGVNRPLNAFQQQVTDLDPNNGCPVVCVPPIVETSKDLTFEDGEIDGQAEAGELLTYTITLTNTGGEDAVDWQIVDFLDPNVVFVSADMGGVHDGSAIGGEVEWNGLLVPADDSIELTVTVQVVDPIPDGVLEIGNVAYSPLIEPPPDCDADPLPPNCAIVPTEPNVDDGKDLVTESGDVDGVAEAGEQLTYEITLTNTGGSDAENHIQIDQLDPNVVFVSADNGGVHDGSATGGDVTWDVTVPAADDLGPGVLVLTVVVQVVDPIPDGVLEIGNVTYDPDEGPPDCDVVDPPPNCAPPLPTEPNVSDSKDLVAESGDTDGVAEAGEELTYEITLVNSGGTDAVNHVQIDQLDPNAIFVSADNGGAHDGSATGGDVTWTVTVPANDTLVLTVVVQVVDPIPDGVLEIGNVTYDPDEGPPDCDVIDPPPNCSDPLPTEPNVDDSKDLVNEDGDVDGEAEAGEQLTYEITLTNTGGSDTVNHVQIDQLDPNTVFVSADNGGVHDGSAMGGDVTWTVTVPAADENGPGVLVLTVVVQVVDPIPAGVLEIGNVTYDPDEGPPDCDVIDPPPNCSPPLPTEPNVSDSKDLVAESGVTDGVAEAGEQLTYEITLANSGGTDAVDHVQIDQLDPNAIFVSADNGGVHDGSATGGDVTWTVTVPANSVLVLTVVVQVVDPIPDGVLEIGNVTYDPDDGPPDCDVIDPPPNCSPPLPTEPNVSDSKDLVNEDGDIDGQAEAGEQLTYEITLVNNGGTDAVDHVQIDQLDANVVFVSADNGGVHDGSATGGDVTWTVTVPADDTVVLTVVVQVVDPIPDGVLEIGNVTYDPDDGPPDCDVPNPPPNCAPPLPTEPQVSDSKDLVTESGDTDGEAEAGEQLTYEITLTNTGGSDAENHVQIDQLDPNVIFVSADNGGVHDGSATGGDVTWTVTVPADDTLVLTVVVQVVDPIPDDVLEIGNVTYDPDEGPPDCDVPNPPPNCAPPLPTEPQVADSKDLVAESGDTDGVAEAGEELTYEITLTNTGGSDAENHVQIDQLDPNAIFVSADNGGVHDGSATGGDVTWTVTVPANDTLVLTVTVQVVDPIPDGVLEIGNVTYDPDEGPPDCDVPNPPPNCAPPLPTEPNTRVEKSLIDESGEMDGIAEPGEVLTYGIRVYNTGGADAVNEAVNEIVPDDTIYVATGSDAWSCADGSGPGTACDFVIATVPGGGFVDLLFRVQVDDPLPQGVTEIANCAGLNGEVPPNPSPQCVTTPTVPQTVIAKALTGEDGQFGGQIEAGEVLTYTLTVTNHGGTDDTNVEVNEIVPDHTATAAGNQNANGALGAWSCADGTLPGSACDLTLATVAAGETITLEFIIQVDDPIPDGVETVANCAGLNGQTPPNPSPQCVTLPTEPSVSVAKALFMEDGDIDGAAEADEILVYELTVVNSGGSIAFGEFLREIVPQHTTFVADPVSSPGWDCPDNSPNPTVCDLDFDIDAGETLNFLFAVQVVDPLPDGVTQIANGIGHGGNPPPCPPGGVHCVVTPTVNTATDKNIVSVTPFGSNAYRVLYEITVSNTGGSDARYTLFDELNYPANGVTLLDPALVETTDGVLEPGIAADNGQFTPVNNNPVQLSDLDVVLPVGESHTYMVAIRIAVDPSQVGDGECTGDPGDGLFNQAMAIGDADSDGNACTPVPSDEPRIGLVKRNRLIDDNGNGYGDVKEDLEYTFEIANGGNVELSSLRLIDAKVRPPQGAWVQCDAPGTPGSGSYVFDDPLEAGENITCTAHYTLSQNDVDNRRVTNTATVVGFAPDGRQVRASHTSIFENFQDDSRKDGK